MRIAIDATSIPPKPAGAGVYAIELIRAMAEHGRHDGYAAFVREPHSGESRWIDALVEGKRNWRVEPVRVRSRAHRTTWEQLRLPRRLHDLRIDVLHSTHHTLPLRPASFRRVVTVHDVTFLRIPQRYPLARRVYMQTSTRLAARVADAIIVPSNTVRADVQRFLHVRDEKLHVVYEAAASRFVPVDRDRAQAVARSYGIEPPFVLSVGSLEPGKNRPRLIRALHDLRSEGIDHRLVVVGQRAWKYQPELDLVRELGMEQQVIFPGYVHAEDLPALYSAADAVAVPSLYEGFGLPVLEAMACGAPVLTSNVGATAEVAGDDAILVDPRSIDAIREGLRSLLCDATLRADLSGRGLGRAAEFSWRRAAAETHAVYEQVVGSA